MQVLCVKDCWKICEIKVEYEAKFNQNVSIFTFFFNYIFSFKWFILCIVYNLIYIVIESKYQYPFFITFWLP